MRWVFLFGCFIFLVGCSDDRVYRLAGSTDKIALVRVVVDLQVLPDREYEGLEGDAPELTLQEGIFLLRYVSELRALIDGVFAGSLSSAVEFQNNAMFHQLPEMPLNRYDRVLLPYKAIKIEDRAYTQLLCDGLGVDAVAGLRIKFFSTVVEKGLLAGLVAGELEEQFKLEMTLTVVSRTGHISQLTIQGKSTTTNPIKTRRLPTPYFFTLQDNKRPYYLDAMQQAKNLEKITSL